VIVTIGLSACSKRSWDKDQQGNFHVLGILETSKCLPVVAPAKEGPDFVVVAKERNEKFSSSVLKDKSKVPVTAAFEKLAS
jgi:hypothetical protein